MIINSLSCNNIQSITRTFCAPEFQKENEKGSSCVFSFCVLVRVVWLIFQISTSTFVSASIFYTVITSVENHISCASNIHHHHPTNCNHPKHGQYHAILLVDEMDQSSLRNAQLWWNMSNGLFWKYLLFTRTWKTSTSCTNKARCCLYGGWTFFSESCKTWCQCIDSTSSWQDIHGSLAHPFLIRKMILSSTPVSNQSWMVCVHQNDMRSLAVQSAKDGDDVCEFVRSERKWWSESTNHPHCPPTVEMARKGCGTLEHFSSAWQRHRTSFGKPLSIILAN